MASVYAFDADNFGDGTPLWKTSLLQPGEVPQPGGNPKPTQGLTSTPVIDPGSSTMYLVSAQVAGGASSFRLHALDITTGQERAGSPVTIHASVPGTNSEAVNGTITLNNSCLQRAALLLSRGTLYIGFSAPADVPGFGIKFTEPIVANGKVFIATAHDSLSTASPQGELDVYGLKH
jgi:outer membrane protein assembly factor BamB